MRGEFARFYHTKRQELVCATNIYPVPVKVELSTGKYWAVGTHISPTIDQRPGGPWGKSPVFIVGPLSSRARSKEDFDGKYRPMMEYLEKIASYFPGIRESDLEPHHAGNLAHLSGRHDWLMTRDRKYPDFIHLLGMDSPALTSCLAIADHVRRIMDAGY